MADTDTKGNSAPFDLKGLNEMYGKETVAELLAMSVDEARGLIAEIGRGISERNSRMVMEAAHQLKGLASTMTINDLANMSLQLETAARQNKWDGVSEMKAGLEKEFEHVAGYIQSILNTM